jgi:hypothetical protein
MGEYKFYCLDRDGRIVKRLDVMCRDDLEAFKRAYDLSSDYAVEVWDGDRELMRSGRVWAAQERPKVAPRVQSIRDDKGLRGQSGAPGQRAEAWVS